MRLAFFIFMMSLSTATIATASPLERINRETPVCLEKQFSAQELAGRPLQTVKSIAMQLYEQPDQKDHTVYMNLQLELSSGIHDAFMICDRSRQGLNCAVECDGGHADVIRLGKDERHLQFVNRGFMATGGCGGSEDDNLLWLEPTPGGDDVFDLDSTVVCP